MATRKIQAGGYRKNTPDTREERVAYTLFKDRGIMTDSWVCPDGSGVWMVTSKVILENFNRQEIIIHKMKLSPMGDILEEEYPNVNVGDIRNG
jgi:hypothetical protein